MRADLIAAMTRAPGYLGTIHRLPVLDPAPPMASVPPTIWAWTNARWVSFFYVAHGDGQSVRDFLGR